jgi:lipopolysaccharide transport system permease protein
MLTSLQQNSGLIRSLIRREIELKYQGSALGLGWYVLSNLATLAIYTVAFGAILNVRWPGRSLAAGEGGLGGFAVMIFSGLIAFNLVAECLNRAPTLLVANPNYVKKVVFPLEILPIVTLGAALFNAAIAFLVLLAMCFLTGIWPAMTAIAAPLTILPLIPILLGISWFLASLGVYLRDISQIVPLLTTVLLFLGPVFFPLSSIPDSVRPFALMNPVTLPIEEMRKALFLGIWPDAILLSFQFAIGLVIAWLGYMWFQQTRRGFADVL